MTVLTALPSQAIINGFKGTVDFYLWKGVACARKWPRWRRRTATPEEAANQDAFRYINQVAGSLDPYIIAQYQAMAAGTPFTWKDLLVRAYMKGIDY